MVVIEQDAEKVRQRYGKVKAEAKAEMKKVRSSLNLDLNLSLLHSLRPCPRNGASWRAGVGRVRSLAFLSILLECFPVIPNMLPLEAPADQHDFSEPS